jgi:hypothetical protein
MANPAGGQSEIGSVSVGIRADNSQLKQGLAESEAQVSQFAGHTERATNRASLSFRTLGRAVRGLVTPFTAVIGTVALLTAAVSRLAGIFQSGESRAKAFGLALGNDVHENLRAVSKEAAEVEAKLAGASDGVLGFIYALTNFTTPGNLREQAADLRAMERMFLKQANAQREANEKESRRADVIKGVEEAEKSASEWRKQNLDAETQKIEQYTSLLQKFQSLRAQAQGGGQDGLVQRLTDAIEGLRNAERERQRIRQEEADRIARRIGEETRRAMQEFTREFLREFRRELTNVVPDIRAIGVKLDLINRNANRKY